MINENTLHTVYWYATGKYDRATPGYYLSLNIILTVLGIKTALRNTPARLCHRCRRDRDDLSCMGCSNYARRVLFESLEEGLLASVVALFAIIASVYLYGVAS